MRLKRLPSMFGLALIATIPLAANARSLFPPDSNYELHELTLNGGDCGVADIDRGVAVGSCDTEAGTRAFAWTEATGMIDLGTLGRGRIAILYEDEFPENTRSVVLVPQ